MEGIVTDNFITGNNFWAHEIPEFLDRADGGFYN
jgi:hypothetical protein